MNKNINNRFEWEDKIDRLLSEYGQEFNRDKRRIMGYEIQKILSEQLPLIFTVTDDRIFAIRNKWKNFYPTTSLNPSVWRNFGYMYEEQH